MGLEVFMDTSSFVLLATMSEQNVLEASLTVIILSILLASALSVISSVGLGRLECSLRDPPALMLRLAFLPSPALIKIVFLPFAASAVDQALAVALSELFAVRRGVIGLCMFQTLNRGAFALATALTTAVGVLATVSCLALYLVLIQNVVAGWNALQSMFTATLVITSVCELFRAYLVTRMSFSYVQESLPAGA